MLRSGWLHRLQQKLALSRPARSGRARAARVIEQLEDRTLLASNVLIHGGPTVNMNVQGAGTGIVTFSPINDNATLAAADIEAVLNAGESVVVQTVNPDGNQDGDIHVDAIVTKVAGAAGGITLAAEDDVFVLPGGAILSTGDALAITIHADTDSTGSGDVTVGGAPGQSGSILASRGGSITIGGGNDPLVEATGAVSVAQSAVISSRYIPGSNHHTDPSTGDSAAIIVNGTRVHVIGTVTATADLGFASGDVAIRAAQSSVDPNATLNPEVLIDGGVVGGQTVSFTSLADMNVNVSQALLARMNLESQNAVRLDRAARITATGDVLIDVNSNLSAVVEARSIAGGSLLLNAALAEATASSSATIDLGGTSVIDAGGVVSAHAGNFRHLSTTADGTTSGGSGSGAAVALVNLLGDTLVTLTDNAVISQASAIRFVATTNDQVVTNAASTAAGAIENEADVRSHLNRNKVGTAAGLITGLAGNAVAALGVTSVSGATRASIETTGEVNSTGQIDIVGQSLHQVVTDASGVQTTGNGVGVAAAVNTAGLTTNAALDRTPRIQAGSVNVSAVTTEGAANEFRARSESGSGAAGASIAGALSFNHVDTSYAADVTSQGTIELGGADLTLSSLNKSTATSIAAPGTSSSGGNLGIGASAALNTGRNVARSQIAGRAHLQSPGGVAVLSSGQHTQTTSAESGAAGAAASVAPAVAVTLVENQTISNIEAGPTPLTTAGSVDILAQHDGPATTTASGAAAGGLVAAGPAIALGFVTDTATASIQRPVNVTAGNVSINARNASTTNTVAHASAKGVDPSSLGTQTTADGQIDAQRAQTSQYAPLGVTVPVIPSARTAADRNGDSLVGVAAAIGVNVAESHASALIADGTAITAAGTVQLDAVNQTIARARADGSAVDGSFANAVGVAVSINVADASNTSRVGEGALVQAELLAMRATVASGPLANEFRSESISGAGAGNVGVAGSVAFNVADSKVESSIGTNADITLGTAAIPGDLQISARDETHSVVRAASTSTGAQVGVGASVAVNASTSQATSSLAGRVHRSRQVDLNSDAVHQTETRAESGTAGGTAVSPAVAIDVAHSNVQAEITSDSSVIATDTTIVHASGEVGHLVRADGEAAAQNVAVGSSIALSIPTDHVAASVSGSVSAQRDIVIRALSSTVTDTAAKGSAVGTDRSIPTTPTAQTQLDPQVAFGSSVSGDAVPPTPALNTADGAAGVAAALAVNVGSATTSAEITGGQVTAGQALRIDSESNTRVQSLADAASIDGTLATDETGSPVNVAAAIAVNVFDHPNSARIQDSKVTAGGPISIAARVRDLDGDQMHTFAARSVSGAGSAGTGVAGSLAINVVRNDSAAAITQATTLAGGDDLSISAVNHSEVTADAKSEQENPPDGATAKVGVGASAAINVVRNTSSATVGAGSSVDSIRTNGVISDSLARVGVTATGDHAVTTLADAGTASADASVAPAAAVTAAENTTNASIADAQNRLEHGGELIVQADQSVQTTTTATATAADSNVGVGASIAVSHVANTVSADIDRDVTTHAMPGGGSGLVTVQATSRSGNETTALAGKRGIAPGNLPVAQIDATSQAQFQIDYGNQLGQGTLVRPLPAAPGITTPDGTVGVAAALALNIPFSKTTASVAGSNTITADGVVTIDSRQNSDARTEANAKAVDANIDGVSTNVATAVAVTLPTTVNEAMLEAATTVAANGLVVRAAILDADGDSVNVLDSHAVSGSAGADVGVAGSFAMTLVPDESQAAGNRSIASIDGTARINGPVEIGSENNTDTRTHAAADDGSFEIGVGASVALNIVPGVSLAQLGNGGRIESRGPLQPVTDVVVDAHGLMNSSTVAESGAESLVAGNAAVGIAVHTRSTTALIDAGDALGTAGNLTVRAHQTTATGITSAGLSTGSDIAIGAAVGFAVVTDQVDAVIDRDVDADGMIGLDAWSVSMTQNQVFTGARGTQLVPGNPQTVDDQLFALRTFLLVGLKESIGQLIEVESPDGDIAAAAAVAVNILDIETRAAIADQNQVRSDTGISLQAKGLTHSVADADASAVNSLLNGFVGAGIAVAVNQASQNIIEAEVEDSDLVTPELLIVANVNRDTGEHEHRFVANALSGAGKSNTDVSGAGSVAINSISDNRTEAVIRPLASVTGQSGALLLEAVNNTTVDADARSKSLSGGFGIGLSVGVNVATNEALATISDRTAIDGFDDVTVRAGATQFATTDAETGVAGGTQVTGAAAVNSIQNEVAATIGAQPGSAMAITGHLIVDASLGNTDGVNGNTAHANGDLTGAGNALAAGASVALNFISNSVTASLDRDVRAAGQISISAASASDSLSQSQASQQGVSSVAEAGSGALTARDQVFRTANFVASKLGGITGSIPAIRTTDGPVGIVAASSINLIDATTQATLGTSQVSAGDAIRITSYENTDAVADAGGDSVQIASDSSNIGAAAAVNLVTISNTASVSPAAVLNGSGIRIEAGIRELNFEGNDAVS